MCKPQSTTTTSTLAKFPRDSRGSSNIYPSFVACAHINPATSSASSTPYFCTSISELLAKPPNLRDSLSRILKFWKRV